ncbi:A disintegrin and metalloproteinase with thrombospondin motifs 3-like, partial [Saccoglossus kowalevskii]|uniref:A disintegrin and metalloproteinase with thrombospondin motifs 3-like n=1 Tax=Saccoglossus kowalevskii TaxID=10224 RepID=A0ABM0M4T2_SACKO
MTASIFIFITAVFSHSILQVHGVRIGRNSHIEFDHLAKKLSDYEIIIPYLSTSDGRFISHRLAPQEGSGDNTLTTDSKKGVRNRRYSTDNTQTNEMHFSLKAFGSEFTLNVHKNVHLVSPGAVVEWMTSSGRREETIQEGCFYIGEVKNKSHSTVAVSNCNGLAGFIQVNGEDYFIEPLEKNAPSYNNNYTSTWNSNDTESDEFLHVMYKRSSMKKSSHGDHDTVAPFNLLGGASDVIGRSIEDRAKRSIGQKHMEVLLTADHSVVDFHGSNNIQIYLLTLMNIVNSVYKHETLGVNLNIALVRIILLDASQASLVRVGQPSQSLENVCRWAHTQQNRDGTNKPHHDHAIFLTRQNFGPAGYAPVTGMCHLFRSCTLNKEDGFSSAFVMAHETGHVLGMEHDGQGSNECNDEASTGSIMAPLVKATFTNYYWSRCSMLYLTLYFSSYQCLLDDPFRTQWPALEEELGIGYSMDDQCEYDFGQGHKRCTAFQGMDLCMQLWCSHPDNPFFCKTKKGPPLDGTSCGPGKWCHTGSCVESRVQITHGSWSNWNEFSECSRSCGIGAQMRTRECNNPKPSSEGDDCKGQNVEFRLCNTQDCQDSNVDFRAQQCEDSHKNWQIKKRKHTWLPHENSNSSLQCKLSCISEETHDLSVSSLNVIDGTRCSYDNSNNICVQGQCQIVGCDNKLGSSLREDQCGVCGGDNSDCRTIRGTYNKKPRKKFQKMVVLPKGARYVEVSETSPSRNTITVKDRETGHYILSNNYEDSKDTVFITAGTKFTYTVENEKETLSASAALQRDIIILVHAYSLQNPEEMKVNYRYVMHKHQVDDEVVSNKRFHDPSSTKENKIPDKSTRFSWEMAGWSDCTKKCGGGYQTFRFVCKRKSDAKIVNRRMCDQSKLYQPETVKRACNTQPCERP